MVLGRQKDWPSYAGLPWATLRALGTHLCPSCGEDAISIPRVAQLHRALAAVIVAKRAPLMSQERRFLRDFIGWTEEDLAQRMGISPEAVEGWERGDEEPGPLAERLLRMLAATRLPGGGLADEVRVQRGWR